ncbi:MAG: alpha/beta fold hydrolase, partial [Xanthomonadales bacterium]|nr:alpha/beta fold hydrolase [Xanthomonadales bacterium]
MPGATQYLEEQREFRFANGERLPWIKLAYETWGELDDARSNAVLILTGLSPSAHAASSEDDPEPGWWEPMVGPGKPIDTRRQFVICVNSLGSCWGSLGPASYNPETGRPYRLDFPALAIEDIAAGAHRVVRHLGIDRLAAVVGPSMGGMSAQAYLLQNPAGARHAVLISTAARAEPFSIAIRSLQREAIQADRRFKEG